MGGNGINGVCSLYWFCRQVLVFKDGRIHDGEFKDGTQHGTGKYYDAQGKINSTRQMGERNI